MRYVLLLLFKTTLVIGLSKNVNGQHLKSPADFLGYPLGSRFTYYHKVIDYFNYVDEQSERVRLFQYGETYELRELQVAYISTPKNLKRIEEIRKNNLRRTGMLNGRPDGSDIAIVWLSYNVHGNEANCTETSMKVLYDLASGQQEKYNKWLEKLVIVLDPCLNPDGRERYVNWYNQVAGVSPNPNNHAREHHEEWPSGRSNHYLFDLNRDWVWQTQKESRQRLKLYNEWLPQIHIDFHEQFYFNQYFFAPSAEPIHNGVTEWQKEFQKVIGKQNAKYFDEKGWLYFTREIFDLLYPGYGDSYPTFNGAIGMTYEMPGHSDAGLAIIRPEGDTLTLRDRIDMHYMTTMSTLEACYKHCQSVLNEFDTFFRNKSDKDTYYVLKSSRTDRITFLMELLDKNGVIYKCSSKPKISKVYSYEKDKWINIKLEEKDLIVPVNQPKSILVEALFERNTELTDTLTYDITAWSVPFAYGLDAYKFEGKIDLVDYHIPGKSSVRKDIEKPYAFLLNWTSIKDARFLCEALTKGFNVSYSTRNFSYGGTNFSAGTLIFSRIDNERKVHDYDIELLKLANDLDRELIPIYSGSAIQTFDLGSHRISFLQKPRIALICGDSVSTHGFGELWYFFEQEIHFPVDVLDVSILDDIDFNEYDVILLASGKYSVLHDSGGFNKVDDWINAGGNLILIEEAIDGFVGEERFDLEKKTNEETESKPVLYPFSKREREHLKKRVQGAIVKIMIDNTHPLAFGYDDYYFTLKNNNRTYDLLQDGWNVGYISSEDQIVAGFIGYESKKELANALILGVENRGEGKVIYFVDNPVFRAFWQNGKLFLANAVFFNN